MPNATISKSDISKNVTDCSNRTAMYNFDPRQMIQRELNESGHGNINLYFGHLLVDRLTAAGYEVVVGVTLPDLDLDWRVTGTPTTLGLNAIHDAQVIVAPALAVDRTGNRLGQGGGSYDRALARRHSDALIVVLLHDDELLPADAVPVDAHDIAVDVVVTPSRGLVRLDSA